MKVPVSTPIQLKMVLRDLRRTRGISQAQLGILLGVSQRRVAAIEAAPERASFDQVARLVLALGGDVLIGQRDQSPPKTGTFDW